MSRIKYALEKAARKQFPSLIQQTLHGKPTIVTRV